VYADALPHQRFNSRELGSLIALSVLKRHINPASRISDELLSVNTQSAASKAVSIIQGIIDPDTGKCPECKLPKTVTTKLPGGGLYYMRSILPVEVDEKVAFVTGDTTTDRVCAVQVDPLGIVIEIACVSASPLPARNIGCMVGWHESYLNSAIYSYEAGSVLDWIDFLNGEWSTVICHEKFSDFAEAVRALLRSDKAMISILDNVMDVSETSDEDAVVTGERRRIVGDRGSNLPESTRKLVESYTLDFLRKDQSLQSHFLVPVPSSSFPRAKSGSVSSKK